MYSNVSSIGPSSEKREFGESLVSLWRRANARNVRPYYPYWQYTDLFIFRFCISTLPTQHTTVLLISNLLSSLVLCWVFLSSYFLITLFRFTGTVCRHDNSHFLFHCYRLFPRTCTFSCIWSLCPLCCRCSNFGPTVLVTIVQNRTKR